MGWGSTDNDNDPIEITGAGESLNETLLESTGLAVSAMSIDIAEDQNDASEVEEVPTSTDVDLYPDSWEESMEEMDFGETIFNWLTIFLPNTAYITVSVFGTSVQLFIKAIRRKMVQPVLNALGSFFDIPLGMGGFDLVALFKEFGSMILGPLGEVKELMGSGVTMGSEFMKPITSCIGSTLKASQELLLGVFQIFPVCVTNLTVDVIQIIVDTMALVEGLSTVLTVVMETLNSCLINPILCIVMVSS